VGIVGHLSVGDGAKIGAQSGVMSDVEPGAVLGGSPSRPHPEWLRIEAALGRLPELVREVRRLQKEIEKLKGKP
jgi:UDP-3-O-[3-hydroxymyristoyl] glucosamine N-acyltransferase